MGERRGGGKGGRGEWMVGGFGLELAVGVGVGAIVRCMDCVHSLSAASTDKITCIFRFGGFNIMDPSTDCQERYVRIAMERDSL